MPSWRGVELSTGTVYRYFCPYFDAILAFVGNHRKRLSNYDDDIDDDGDDNGNNNILLLYIYVSSSCQLALLAYPDWGFSVLFPQL